MASLYKRDGKWWLRYKSGGKWKGAPTGYSVGDRKETLSAERICAKRSKEEETLSRDGGDSRWECWVLKWIEARWGHLQNNTPILYRRYWNNQLEPWLKEIGVDRPSRLTRQQCLGYAAWRSDRKGNRNTAALELTFLGQIIDEAVYSRHCESNPCRKLGIQKEEPKHKVPWTDHQIETVGSDLNKEHFGSWMHVTFLMGLYQAARLQQAQLPLNCFDFNHNVIYYPLERVKGGKFFAQPIDIRLRETLLGLVSERIKDGEATLCNIPQFPSVIWRKFLDEFGFSNISHHGLRVTWATRACLAGVPMAQAMKFCNHSSELVHKVYQQLSVGDLESVPLKVAFPVFSQQS